MRLSSLRLSLLTVIARLLRRWLGVVTAQLESAPPTASEPDRPKPPDHWVELVRQYAPQLLEPDAPGVIDYRADDPPPPGVSDSRADVRKIAMPTPLARPQRATHPPRPLRLERISARSLAAREIEGRAAAQDAGQIDPPTVTPTPRPPDPARIVPQIVTPDVQAEAHAQSADAAERTRLAPHYADLPFEQTHIRETRASLPAGGRVPSIRTHADGGAQARPLRPPVPETPPQIVMRPTLVPSAPEFADVRPDRWPTLPDPPAEEQRDPAIERQRRERLIREQEGRAWSE